MEIDALDKAALEAALVDWFGTTEVASPHKEMFAFAITAYKRAREEQGHVEVPVEPTDDMINDAVDVWHQPELRMLDDQTKDMWRAMIAARPQKEGE